MLHENIGRKTLRAFHDTILEWKCSHSSHMTIVIENLIKISLKFPLESFRKAFRKLSRTSETSTRACTRKRKIKNCKLLERMRNISLSSQQHVQRADEEDENVRVQPSTSSNYAIFSCWYISLACIGWNLIRQQSATAQQYLVLNNFSYFFLYCEFFWVLLLSEMRREIPPLMWVLCVLSELASLFCTFNKLWIVEKKKKLVVMPSYC